MKMTQFNLHPQVDLFLKSKLYLFVLIIFLLYFCYTFCLHYVYNKKPSSFMEV